MNIPGYQVATRNIGQSGCYFLSILRLAEGLDPSCYALDEAMGLYFDALEDGIMGEDCFVNDPAKLFDIALGLKTPTWKVRKEPATYKTKPGELEILRYDMQKTGALFSHFVVGDGLGNVIWDPWPGSATVKNGMLASKRIFYK